jgi:hypothetical protein
MKHVERDHVDVLQTIEFFLVQIARQDPAFDDRIVDQALRSCIKGTAPPEDADGRIALLVTILEGLREKRRDVSDDIWEAALRTVHESVKVHSALSPGEKTYLEFIEDFFPDPESTD